MEECSTSRLVWEVCFATEHHLIKIRDSHNNKKLRKSLNVSKTSRLR